MTETERAKVGRTLDSIRDALASYVDDAMATAYGPKWNELVADEDAKRRPTGHRQEASKTDLAVLLKAIQHRRISPWWKSETYVDPRIRSFSSEILTLRNMHAHGNDCLGEDVRLVDTAGRLLQMLALPVPSGLQPPRHVPTLEATDDSDMVSVAVLEQPPLVLDVQDGELARLGESGERVALLLRRAQELPEVLYRQALEAYESEPGSATADYVQSQLEKTKDISGRKITGADILDLLDETFSLELNGHAEDAPVLQVVALFVRCTLLDGALGLAALSYALAEVVAPISAESALEERDEDRADRLKASVDRMAWLTKLSGQSDLERWREFVGLADKLSEGSSMANLAIVQANLKLLDDPEIDSDEALRLLNDSSERTRMLAAMEPGAQYETFLVHFLRREGKLLNDLGRPDEAEHSFARADEILDRYPTADPHLVYWNAGPSLA